MSAYRHNVYKDCFSKVVIAIIVTIAFYNKRTHKIRKTIDIVYYKDGNVMAYKNVVCKGKTHTIGHTCACVPKTTKMERLDENHMTKTTFSHLQDQI